MKKDILITGVTGFLGSHVLKELVKRKDLNLICLKRSFSNISRIKDLDSKSITFYDVDMTNLTQIFENHNISAIIHMATEYGRVDTGVAQILETNLVFPIKLIEVAIKFNVKVFINTDSYFNKANKSYNYLLNYSLSKKSLLNWLENFSNKINIVNIVLEHVFGELDNDNKFIEFANKKIAIDKVTTFNMTYGHQKRDFIYVKDVASAYEKILDYALFHNFKIKNFEVGLGKAVELRYIVELIKRYSNSETHIEYGSIAYRSDEIMESFARNQELLEIGWKPKYSINDGVINMLKFYGIEVPNEPT